MPEQTTEKQAFLNQLHGYQEGIKHKQELESCGSDFADHRGKVANTIATLHPKRLDLTVAEIIDDTASTKTLRLVSSDDRQLPPFQAGQYINLFVNIDGVETARPYAISSAPLTRTHYDLTIKRVTPGYVTHFLLDRVKVGDRFQSTGPMGTFYHNPLFHGEDLVFLAGGSGIAPAISMIREIADRQHPYRFHLIYASSYENDIIFDQELKQLSEQLPNLILDKVISRPTKHYEGLTGHLSAEFIQQRLETIENKMFYICGPTPFNEYCAQQLSTLAVKPRHVRIEANGPPKHPEQQPGWPQQIIPTQEITVTVQGGGSFKTPVNEPLLNALERNGYGTENACRSGECSLCRVKITKGKVFNPSEAHLRTTDQQYGWCHSCVAFPLEDIEIQL
ncbi:2Fe-2S iron-sulfur cluster binding domain-containing protein [Pseudomaricurvus alkylphenolicus]|uniref:FAD-binding oxidoreductase n=1 Tax=Pseudomaricurvus alkylphenolicus TaxID=1306991 RepID=UPI00142345B2|nr:FAD-binding oxidoreductase [Pseudomaricurvus alkylphenolicus]NIB41024.1 2Fe-2S iron-sulfur cluster binding domain-containing protein [Pseudomaricurvus alkylphenolicus]